ncbi:MAG: hypothetical protein IT225_07100 [Flavobacteriales bacterium]|nr:hypothetical protein [Flavobacteriales bacterium]
MRLTMLLRVLIVATALVLCDVFTIEHFDACPDEHLPSLIGSPFAYRTSVPWVNSLSGELYLQGLVANIACWSMVLTILVVVVGRLIGSYPPLPRYLRMAGNGLVVLALVFVLLFFVSVEWRVAWAADLPFRCEERTVQWMIGLR